MEIIDISGYTVEEKLQIAKTYLLPRQIKENGITDAHIKFDDEMLKIII